MGKLVQTFEKELDAWVFKRRILLLLLWSSFWKKLSFLHCFLGISLFLVYLGIIVFYLSLIQ